MYSPENMDQCTEAPIVSDFLHGAPTSARITKRRKIMAYRVLCDQVGNKEEEGAEHRAQCERQWAEAQ